jgi:hypothetical protein
MHWAASGGGGLRWPAGVIGCRGVAADAHGPSDSTVERLRIASPMGAQCAIKHSVRTLLAQRVLGIAAGYEDLNDHDAAPRPGVGGGDRQLEARRSGCARALTGKSTLNRWSSPLPGGSRAITRSAMSRRRSSGCSWICSWKRTAKRHGRSCLIWMRPMIRCTAARRAVVSRVLRRVLLSAAVHLRRAAPAGGEAAALEHRCLKRRG